MNQPNLMIIGAGGVGEGVDGQRLRDARQTFEEDVLAADHGDDDRVDHVLLADDDLADLIAQGVDLRARFLDLRLELGVGRTAVRVLVLRFRERRQEVGAGFTVDVVGSLKPRAAQAEQG